MVRDEDLEPLLRALRREPAPDVPLDAILERWRRRGRARVVIGSLALAGAIAAGLLLFAPSRPEPAPIHLKLKLVQIPDEEASAEELGP